MKISRNTFAFVSMLAAGILLAGATVLLPATSTFGSETDEQRDRMESIEHNLQLLSQAPQPAPPAAQPAPPAAPIDQPAASAQQPSQAPSESESPDASSGANQLPSAGNGGYLNAETNASIGYGLIGVGIALMGSGSMVWAYSRRRR